MVTQTDVDTLLELSPEGRMRIIEQLAQSLVANDAPKRKPYGLIEADVSEEDIETVRREMWENLPREDV